MQCAAHALCMDAPCSCMGALSLLGQVVHAADISNPAKVQTLQTRWTQKVMTEF